MNGLKRIFVVGILVLTAMGAGFSASYNALVGVTPINNFWFMGGFDTSSLNDLTNLSLTPYGSIFMGVAPNLEVAFSGLLSEMIVRYDISGNNTILGLGISGTSLSPRFDMVMDFGALSLELNVKATLPLVNMGEDLAFSAVVAPVLVLNDNISLFVEIDPSYSMNTNTGFNLKIVPGITIADGPQGITVVATLDGITGTLSPSVGFCYWMTFDTTKPEVEK